MVSGRPVAPIRMKSDTRVVFPDLASTYQGNYGMFRPEEQWVIELTRYTAVDGSAVLFANWYEKDSGNEGSSMFELKPQ